MFELQAMKLTNCIRQISTKKQPNTMVFGTVTSLLPLAIDIGNGIVLNENQLFLGQMCRAHSVTIPHTHLYSGKTDASVTGIKGMAGEVPVTITEPVSTDTPPITGHSHTITNQSTQNVTGEVVTLNINPVLKEGDRVLMFAFNDFQMYYVAERIELV